MAWIACACVCNCRDLKAIYPIGPAYRTPGLCDKCKAHGGKMMETRSAAFIVRAYEPDHFNIFVGLYRVINR